jgi:hypothetical protein
MIPYYINTKQEKGKGGGSLLCSWRSFLACLLGCPADETTHTDLLQMAVNAIIGENVAASVGGRRSFF